MKDTLKNPPDYLKGGPGRSPRRRRLFIWALGITVLLLLSIIVSQQLWLWRFIPPDTASDTLLLYALSTLNFVAFVVFSFIFIRNLLKLRLERRERQPGSRIKSRLLFYFIAISFLPIIAMAVFSYLFLNRSLEKWFGRVPARLVNEAQEVQREAVDAQFRNLRDTASLLAVVLNPQSDAERQQTLDRVVAGGQISAIEIVDTSGEVVSKSRGALPSDAAAEVDSLLRKARAPGAADVASLADGKDFDLVSVKLADNRQLIVVPLRRASNDLGDTLSGSEGEYQKLAARQRRVRRLGLSTLGLMTLMLLFVSSWVAIYLARGIATPIKALAEASKEIARGNLTHRVTTLADDELALLADSFNQMTAQLEDNRTSIDAGSAALREKNLTLEERRNYIETVLESLSTGVISLNDNDAVTTINAAASRMLRMSSNPLRDSSHPLKLVDLIARDDWLVLDRVLRRARRTGQSAEQAQLTGDSAGASLPVALNATALGTASAENRGVVLVIEDLSELLAAQRVAAWSEVAKRMAHEIKNPLTPIQLSAERIAKSYRRANPPGNESGSNGNGLLSEPGADRDSRADRPPGVGEATGSKDKAIQDQHVAAIINECTETIAREVAGLKAMVDEFSRFARLPLAKLEVANLNEVIRQAVALYDDRFDGVTIGTELDPELPSAMLDSEQLRRVFVNLIDNANNALADIHGDRRINVATSFDSGRSVLLAEVSDTGHGIRPDDFKRLFQPYFSTRGSGTGLGLAIVQRIIMEHGGRIRAEMNSPRGARFVIELPSASAETGDGRPTTVNGD
ncbi:MAG TPA: ATP-binding protein [Pyrinomonadaceae bacterium]|nr:ATP-binding protein [Pyrinomonadaceae bacterium]